MLFRSPPPRPSPPPPLLPTGDRLRLWEEKVGLRAPFAGNEATAWGTAAEPQALAAYQALTGQHVEGCMFSGKHVLCTHTVVC